MRYRKKRILEEWTDSYLKIKKKQTEVFFECSPRLILQSVACRCWIGGYIFDNMIMSILSLLLNEIAESTKSFIFTVHQIQLLTVGKEIFCFSAYLCRKYLLKVYFYYVHQFRLLSVYVCARPITLTR